MKQIVILSDGETWGDMEGARILGVPDNVDDVDQWVKENYKLGGPLLEWEGPEKIVLCEEQEDWLREVVDEAMQVLWRLADSAGIPQSAEAAVQFAGGGDSGNVSYPEFYFDRSTMTWEECQEWRMKGDLVFNQRIDWRELSVTHERLPEGGYRLEVTRGRVEPTSLSDILVSIADTMLDRRVGDWYNDSGGHGSVCFKRNGDVVIDFYENMSKLRRYEVIRDSSN
jgi:hypothetical protein